MTETQLEANAPAAVEEATEQEVRQVSERLTVIKPASRRPTVDLRELWVFRELAAVFAWRDLKVRYKQTAIGVAWALIQPFVAMVVFTLIFGKFAQFPSQDLPYPVFLYSAMLPWNYFSSSFTGASGSVSLNAGLVTKVYFPRLLLPFSAIVAPAVDFVLASSILFGMMIWFHIPIGPQIVLAPLFMLLAAVTALGAGSLFAAVNVRYRDVPYVLPFIVQIWFYVSGVVFPIAALDQKWQWVLSLNPMAAVIGGFRWALVGTPLPPPGQLAVSVASALALFLAGVAFFKSSESRFADTI